jgi:hypothetical protein
MTTRVSKPRYTGPVYKGSIFTGQATYIGDNTDEWVTAELAGVMQQQIEELRAALTASEKLAAYGAAVLAESREEFGDLDGGFLHDKAVEVGALVEVEVTEACAEEGCHCAEYGDFPQSCYRYAPGVQEIIDKSKAAPELFPGTADALASLGVRK